MWVVLASTPWVLKALPLGPSIYLSAASFNGPEVTVSDAVDVSDSCGGGNVEEGPYSEDPDLALAAVLGLGDGRDEGEDSCIKEA